MLGWVVQTCFRSYEHFWSPCHQGNDLCKFCGIQHATSEVSFQYRVFLCRSMDDTTLNNVDNGPICCSMMFLWRIGINFGFETSVLLLHAKMHRLGGGLRASNVLHGTRPIQVFQWETVIAKSEQQRVPRFLLRCECFNNKNRSRHRRLKYYQQGTAI